MAYKVRNKSNNQKQAVDDIALALEKAFKKFTLSTRKNAWEKIQSKKGKQAIDKILLDPDRNVKSLFEPLTFKEWFSSKNHSL